MVDHPRGAAPRVGTASARGDGLAPTRHVLANGLAVWVKETVTTPAVTIHAGVRAGSGYDALDCPGVAHFVSKVIDRGAASRTADQIAAELDERGVSLSVALNRHAMWVTCTCLKEDFEDVLGIVAAIVSEPRFPAKEIETRRGEIVTLLRQDQDNPAAVAVEALMRMLYGGDHPYGWPTRGSLDAAERVQRTDLAAFHARRFSPYTTSLALVGDVDVDRALAATETVFGSWRGVPAPALALPPLPAVAGRRVEVRSMMNKAQADIAYGFTTIDRLHPQYYAYSVMNNILGQYAMGGRLGERIREQEGMAYYTFSSLDASFAPGPLTVRAGVSPANVDRAVASIDAELLKMAEEGPTDEELAESKQYLIGSLPRTLETNMGIAAFLQTSELFGLGLDFDLRLPGLLRDVALEQVHAAARAALNPSRASLVVAGPYSGPLQ